MQLAFEEAWRTIAVRYGTDAAIDAARLRLAECINVVTPDGSTDAEEIKRVALAMLGIIEL